MKNRKSLIREIAKDTGFTQRDIAIVIESFEKVIMENMKNDEPINMCGFGRFNPKIKEEMHIKNPTTGESIIVPPHKMVKFEVSEIFKKYVNE